MSITGQNLSIVIVTLKSEDVIFKCLESIDSKIPIFIVENSNNLQFKKSVEKRYNNVSCVLTARNLGMGSGNNLGIRLVETDYVLILNPDVILEPNALKELMLASEKIKDFAILSPISIKSEYPNYKLYQNDKPDTRNNFPFKVRSVDGYAMLFNKKKVNKILEKESINKEKNYFDENFFMYLENDDLCKRITENRGDIFVTPKAKINHLGAKAVNEKYRDEVEFSRNWHWMWSKFYFNKKHYGFFQALSKISINFLSSIIKYLFYSIFLNNYKKNIYKMRLAGAANSIIGKSSWFRPNIKN